MAANSNYTPGLYTDPVNFTGTGRFGCGPEDEDDVYTVDEFRALCKAKMFVDSDGSGEPVKDGLSAPNITIYPSDLSVIPDNATHIVWFNK